MTHPNPADTFLQEADDLLVRIEDIALEAEGTTPPAEAVNEMFRAFHTIKGSGGMFGFDAVAEFTHHVETALDKVREGLLPFSENLLALILAAKDQIKALLEESAGGEPAPAGNSGRIVSALNAILNKPGPAYIPSDSLPSIPEEHNSKPSKNGYYCPGSTNLRQWRIYFRPNPLLMASGMNPIATLNELRGLGECEVVAHTEAIPDLEHIDPERIYIYWEIRLVTDKPLDSIKDVFIFAEDGSDIAYELLESPQQRTPVVAGFAPGESQDATWTGEDRTSPSDRRSPDYRKPAAKESTVRVPSGKLDRLVNLVGELVMNQSRLTQAGSRLDAPDLAAPVEEIERLVAELRDSVLGIRMMPIGTTFGRFKRLVHDLSGELGKEIDLVTEGAETELDKTVLDQLGDPLIHLIRNSIDHGIEPAEQRIQRGKPRRGTIRLTAVHTGSNVVVSIHDDGRGLDPQAIRKKAIEKGLISQEGGLSESEIFNLIFLPGFSTAQQVTNISGRGVGMDVVKRQIDSFSGSVAITSQIGLGTTIALTLPLTLAIIDGLLVEIAEDQFIVPMSMVSENVELLRSERSRKNGRNLVAVRGEQIPYIDVRENFGIEGAKPDIEKVVIVGYEDQRVGLVVDRVLGNHQTVIQSLGKFYKDLQAFSGATIMGDGRVALIVDVGGLVRLADRFCPSALPPLSAVVQ